MQRVTVPRPAAEEANDGLGFKVSLSMARLVGRREGGAVSRVLEVLLTRSFLLGPPRELLRNFSEP